MTTGLVASNSVDKPGQLGTLYVAAIISIKGLNTIYFEKHS